MKLADALLEKADLQKRISQMEERLRNNAQVQEGEKPAEDPKFLLAELADMIIRLEELTAQVNLTNSAVMVEGETLTRMLARRDAWRQHIKMLRVFLDSASYLAHRARQSEIKILSTVPVAEIQREQDRRSKALRELDAKIQAANWTQDLFEK